eukprot:TRINITY_DN7129_c0_g1_i1.p1 TRINITY_DN7129_c0_g1~~TRINITY_DN7129_c0_g1_i1.p1  ORF type:complete len:655 (+),score=140.82 TRINITY_DN7129_c0_g1_i1:74-2038(+)
MESGTLFISVVSGRDISTKEVDSYCSLTLTDRQNNPIKNSKSKTKVCKKSKQPEWAEIHEFYINAESSSLLVKLRTKGTFQTAKIGTATIPVSTLRVASEMESWFEVTKDGKSHGELLIKYRFEKPVELREKAPMLTKHKHSSKRLSRMFNAPAEERVVEKLSCAYHAAIPLQGTLYITRHHLFFASLTKKIKINLSSIVAIEKKSAILIIPTALRIVKEGEKEYLFSGIYNRDKIASLIMDLRQKALDEATESHDRSDVTDLMDDDEVDVDESFLEYSETPDHRAKSSNVEDGNRPPAKDAANPGEPASASTSPATVPPRTATPPPIVTPLANPTGVSSPPDPPPQTKNTLKSYIEKKKRLSINPLNNPDLTNNQGSPDSPSPVSSPSDDGAKAISRLTRSLGSRSASLPGDRESVGKTTVYSGDRLEARKTVDFSTDDRSLKKSKSHDDKAPLDKAAGVAPAEIKPVPSPKSEDAPDSVPLRKRTTFRTPSMEAAGPNEPTKVESPKPRPPIMLKDLPKYQSMAHIHELPVVSQAKVLAVMVLYLFVVSLVIPGIESTGYLASLIWSLLTAILLIVARPMSAAFSFHQMVRPSKSYGMVEEYGISSLLTGLLLVLSTWFLDSFSLGVVSWVLMSIASAVGLKKIAEPLVSKV